MSQHDYNLANASGPAFRADANAALASIVTQNAGPTAPSPSFANQIWFDTGSGFLMKRDNANTTWQRLFAMDASGNYTFRANAADRNMIQVRNAANENVVVLRVDTAGGGRVIAEDVNSVQRVQLIGSTAGGKIFIDGDESTGKQVAPSLVLGPFAVAGTTGQTVTGLLGATSVAVAFSSIIVGDASSLILQLGASSGLVVSGYVSGSVALTEAGAVLPFTTTTGFVFRMGVAGQSAFGISHLMTTGLNNIWAESHGGRFGTYIVTGGGALGLPGPLTHLRLTGSAFTSGHFTVHVRY